jgi:hypothetical protein
MQGMWFELILYALTAVALCWIAFPSARRLRSQGESFAHRNQAYVDPEFVPVFNRAVTRADRFTAALILVGLVALRIIDVRRVDTLPLELHLVPLLGVSLAVWAGFRLRTAGREFPVPGGRAAVARPRRVTVTDYVPRSAQILTGCAAGSSVALAVVTAVLWQRGELDPSPAALTAVGAAVVLGMAVLTQVFGWAMCDRPQAAVDACHLYFQDAWRAESLTWAHFAVCWSAFFLCGGLFASAVGPPLLSAFLEPLSWVLGAVGVCVLALPRRRFRRSLWPTLLPGQVLLPGQPVPPRADISA